MGEAISKILDLFISSEGKRLWKLLSVILVVVFVVVAVVLAVEWWIAPISSSSRRCRRKRL